MSDIDTIQKIDVKVFATKGEDIDPYEFVPVLQRWIQEHTIPGTLIDVADYSHMHEGPGIILVGHQYNVSVDYTSGKMGLLFRYKRPAENTFAERVQSAARQAARVQRLEPTMASIAGPKRLRACQQVRAQAAPSARSRVPGRCRRVSALALAIRSSQPAVQRRKVLSYSNSGHARPT